VKLKAHDVLVVVGIRGAGKSYWIARHIVKRHVRVVVWDPHGEYQTVERCTLDELAQDPSRLDREALSLGVVPSWRTLGDLGEQFAIFADLCSSMEGVTIVVEEVGLLSRHAPEAIEFIACQSRHWECPIVLCAQRAMQVPKTAREQLSHLTSFRQSSPSDVAALVERCGEGADKVRTLPRRECWRWSEDESFGDVDDDEPRETSPAGASPQEQPS
jgi:hypothetical protein